MLELALKNYRRFVDQDTLTFPPGLTIVTGPNGVGKTTLAEAISYALFGARRGPGGASVRSDNAVGMVEVQCMLQIDGRCVKVSRRGNSSADLSIDGTQQVAPQPGSIQLVNNRLRGLLGGLTREQFEGIYVAEQGQTAGLLNAKPNERAKVLEVALQLDVLKGACTLQEEKRNTARAIVVSKGGTIADRLELATNARDKLQSFDDARVERTRVLALEGFLGDVDEGCARLVSAANAAMGEHATAKYVAEEARDNYERQKADVEQARVTVDRFAEQKSTFDLYVAPIASAEALHNHAKSLVEERRQQIASAEACAEADTRFRQVDAELSAIRERLKQLPLLEARWTALKKATDDVSAATKTIEDYGDPSAKLSDAESDQDALGIRLAELQNDPTAAEQGDLTRREGMLEQQEKDARAALVLLLGNEQQAQDDDEHHALCPTCNQKLDAHAREERIIHLTRWLEHELPLERQQLSNLSVGLAADKKAWEAERHSLDGKRQNLVAVAAQARSDLKALHAAQTRLVQIESDRNRASEEWINLAGNQPWDPKEQQRLELTQADFEEELRNLSEAAAQYKELPRLQREMATAVVQQQKYARELAKHVEEQDAIGYDAAMHEQANQVLDAAQRTLEALGEKRHEAAQVEQLAETNAKRALEIASSGAKDASDFHDVTLAYRQEEQLTSLLSRFHQQYFQLNTEAIAQRANELILQAITDGSIQGVRFMRGQELQYLDSSYALQPVNRLSGGEKAVVGLCLRIAVAEQALRISETGRLRFLILDEVLGSLDEERLEAMQVVFQTVQTTGQFEHVIMITHLETVRQNWQGSRLSIQKTDAKASRAEFANAGLEAAFAE